MKLLVTGGAGYVGSIVTLRLIDAGHDVTVLDNLERGHREAVAPTARFVQADLREAGRVHQIVAEGFDGVLHFAALSIVGESVAQPDLYYRTNVVGTLNLLEAMRDAQVPRLVFSSTAAVYGDAKEMPIREDAPTAPVNAYGASKLAVDNLIRDFCVAFGLGAASLRYFNVAGSAGDTGEDHHPETHLIPNVLRAAQGRRDHVEVFGTDYPTPDGTAIRDYIHVEDLATAHLLALEAVTSGVHRVYNLGSGDGYSVRQVIDAVRAVTGVRFTVVESPRRAGDPPRLIASADMIRSDLGWAPTRDLTTMVADAWTFAQSHPDGYADSDQI